MKNKKKNTSIQKEIFILVLLLILIMLILLVCLYEFIPNNINVENTISYSADPTTIKVKQEIQYTNNGDSTADISSNNSVKGMDEYELNDYLQSYTITSSQLDVYKQKKLYNSGNANPFDYASEDPAGQANGSTPGGANGGSTPGNSNSTTGTFFEKPNSK